MIALRLIGLNVFRLNDRLPAVAALSPLAVLEKGRALIMKGKE